MLDFTPSPTAPKFAFEPYDEVVIHDISYRPTRQYGDQYQFVRSDKTGVAENFGRGELAHLATSGALIHKPGAFLPEGNRKSLSTQTCLTSAVTGDVAERLKIRGAFVLAFIELQAEGQAKRTDRAIEAVMPKLCQKAAKYYLPATQDEGDYGSKKHGGTPTLALNEISPRTLRRWLKQYDSGGLHALLDQRSKSGYRLRRLPPEALAIMYECARTYASPECPTIVQIVQDVRAAFEAANVVRSSEGLRPLTCPSRETIRIAIDDLDPYETMVARKGLEAARKHFAPVARGLDLQRPLQRVEMDEWRVDLVSLMSCSLGMSYFSDEDIKRLGLTGKKKRFWLTVIMCATTRCILGMRLSRAPTSQSALQTVEMMLQDKGVWTDASGALAPWHMQGKPELLVTDCGSAFTSVDFTSAMEDLGIRVERAPAGFPEMRGRIERLFRTMSTSLMPRLTGRTFSNVIERGDYDSKAKAALTVDDFSEALVRWVVDYYHLKMHEGLGKQSPIECWDELIEQYGVQPAPSLRHRRLVFGTQLGRTVSKAGIEVLKVRYHSERLARWMLANRNRQVEIRYYHGDLGAIEVQLDGEWFEVPAVHEFFRGVPARVWQASLNMLQSSSERAYELNEEVMMQAIAHIKSINENAMKRIAMLTEDRSADWIARQEDRLFDCFTLSRENLAADPERETASGSWGYEFKTSEQMGSGENTNCKTKEISENCSQIHLPSRAAQSNPATGRLQQNGKWKMNNGISHNNRHAVRKTIRALRKTYVTTARDQQFMKHFERELECDDEGNLVAEPIQYDEIGGTHGILLLDGAGGGKTSLVHRALSRHPALQNALIGTMPWVSVRVPSPATLKSLGFAILKETGYYVTKTRRERWAIWELIRERFNKLGTIILWIDEAHDLFHSGSKREIDDMLKTIKALMQGDSAVIVILTGVSTLGQITNVDAQVSRRFSRIDLPSVTYTTDGDALSKLVCSYCDKAGLFAPNDPQLVARLIHASRGRFGRCIENIINSIELALSHGEEQLCVDHFAENYAMQESCAPGHNVFLVPNWSQIDLKNQEAA